MNIQQMYANALAGYAPRQAQAQSIEQQAQQLYQNLLSQGVDPQAAHAHVLQQVQQYQQSMQAQQQAQPAPQQMQVGDQLTNSARQHQGHGTVAAPLPDGGFTHD